MKTKILNLALFTLVLCLTSCSSSDDDSDVSPEGSWMLTSLIVETAFDFNEDGTASRDLFLETPCYDGDFVTFNDDGTARVKSALTYISSDVNSSTDYTHVYQCLEGFDTQSTWTRDGNTLTIEYGSDDLVGTVSGNKLTVNIPDFFQMELYNGTDYIAVEEDVTLIYIKE